MAYLEELLPEFRKGTKIRRKCWVCGIEGVCKDENYSFNACDVDADDWEVVPDKPIDWDYIIKNKCLCYFSNYDYSANYFGYLKGREEDDNCFIDNKLNKWKNCRPVRKDEVTFYEDRKDE